MNERLGNTYQDVITGFTGVCIGHVEYMTGCNLSLIQPRGDGDSMPESCWIDDKFLSLVDVVTKVSIDNVNKDSIHK